MSDPSQEEIEAVWWCIKARDGWHASARNVRPAESANSVRALCEHFIVLPLGSEQKHRDEIDCVNCAAALERVRTEKKG
jgi:hypothetical protein